MQTFQTIQHAPIHWGVLSVANIGVKRVIPAILASSSEKLVAVASRNIQRAQEKFAHLPGVRLYSDYESLLRDPEIDAVYIPLPNSMHAEWTIKALEAGKHVLCEKPMAVTAEQGTMMVETAELHGRLLMEACMYRFHPQTIWALEQVHSGRIGNVKLVRSSFAFNIMNPPHPRNIRLQAALAGGSLMDVGCYPINFCRAVYGHAPIAVAARVFAQGEGEVELSANAVLDFGDGRFGLIDASFELPTRQVAEVIGEQGSITIPLPFTPPVVETEVVLNLEGQTIHQRIAAIDQYRLEVEHFGLCIRTGTQPVYGLNETIDNLHTIEAVYESAGHPWPLA
ncbi:MAG TPA: Gfo/Idh/MocA family oxidoreductase [Ktedonobacteraceae bacterium]|nr:Gfo/Idh/MocA family oxidoreductase [Ktedonobacteraceae bacterium]